jgi:Uma2 family endonuclease
MAVAPIPTLVPVDEYLNSSYRPDVEYVDGVLVERGLPTIAHSLLQIILVSHFRLCRKQFRFAALTEVRTQIIERARYRIPDVVLCPVPQPTGKIVTSVPWVIVEILSPDDKLPDQIERFRDYQQIGVRHVVLLGPEGLIAYRFEDGTLVETKFTSLDLPSGSLPFETTALFRQLVEERGEGAAGG